MLVWGEKHSLVRESIGSARVSEGEGCVGSSGWRNVLSSCEMQCDNTGSDAILFTVGSEADLTSRFLEYHTHI